MKKLYSCVACGRPTTTKHEIFFGSAYRDLSIEYLYQVPLCDFCHANAHGRKSDASPLFGKKQKAIKKYFCKLLNCDYEAKQLCFNTGNKMGMLEGIEERAEILTAYEI